MKKYTQLGTEIIAFLLLATTLGCSALQPVQIVPQFDAEAVILPQTGTVIYEKDGITAMAVPLNDVKAVDAFGILIFNRTGNWVSFKRKDCQLLDQAGNVTKPIDKSQESFGSGALNLQVYASSCRKLATTSKIRKPLLSSSLKSSKVHLSDVSEMVSITVSYCLSYIRELCLTATSRQSVGCRWSCHPRKSIGSVPACPEDCFASNSPIHAHSTLPANTRRKLCRDDWRTRSRRRAVYSAVRIGIGSARSLVRRRFGK